MLLPLTLALRNVAKSFGTTTVFHQLNLEIPQGALHGIIGPNGTGKTTFFRLLLGLLPSDAGTITWKGTPLTARSLNMAYVPEERGLYPHMSVRQQLRWFGRLAGLHSRDAATNADQWLERLELGPYAATAASDLSKGNARKVQLAIGLLTKPDLIILDEPFDGMDPANIHLVQTLLKTLHTEGVTILLSSHSLDFMDHFCDSFTMLHQGSAALHGPLSELRRTLPWQRLTVRFRTPDATERLRTWTLPTGLIPLEAPDAYTALYQVPADVAEALSLERLWELGPVATVSLDSPSLTDIYWHVYESAHSRLQSEVS